MATVLPSALTAAITRPSLVARPDFLAALAMPFWRSQSTAFFQVALHFHQGFLAVHHAGAGLFAQFLHHSGGK